MQGKVFHWPRGAVAVLHLSIISHLFPHSSSTLHAVQVSSSHPSPANHRPSLAHKHVVRRVARKGCPCSLSPLPSLPSPPTSPHPPGEGGRGGWDPRQLGASQTWPAPASTAVSVDTRALRATLASGRFAGIRLGSWEDFDITISLCPVSMAGASLRGKGVSGGRTEMGGLVGQ